MKKLTFIFLSLFTFSLTVQADFSDVPSTSEYSQSINSLQQLGVVEGYDAGVRFDPTRLVSRAEFLKMVFLAQMNEATFKPEKEMPFDFFMPVSMDEPCFPDVKLEDWFAPYVCWAKAHNMVSGYSDGNFYPHQTVNVAEAVKILAKEKDEFIGGHWANGYFQQIGPHTLPTSINAADQLLTRENTAEMIWRYYLATDDQLESKPSKILSWDWNEKKFLDLEFIGKIIDSPINSFWYGKFDNEVYILKNIKIDTTGYQLNLNEPIPLNEFRPLLLTLADADTFKIVTNTINHKNEPIEFSIALDKYALYEGDKYEGDKKVEGSHGGNFSLLEGSFERDMGGGLTYYGRDSEVVYLINCWDACGLSNVLANSNADTFQFLGDGFSKDQFRVYHGYSPLPESDPQSFVSLGKGYGKDGSHVFLKQKILELADPQTFERLIFPHPQTSTCWSTFSKDKENLFIEGNLIPGVDLATFEFLHPYGLFFKDKDHIYHTVRDAKGYTCFPNDAAILQEANMESFKRLGSNYFLSEGKIYFVSDEGEVSLTEANPDSFEVFLGDEEDPDQMQPIKGYFAKDEKNVYFKNFILKDVDLQTFTFSDQTFWKDKNKTYTWSDFYEMTGEI